MLTVFLYLVVFPILASSQFLSYDAIRMRVPGRCMQGDYDCGLGQCVSISQFRDGKPDCMDGSDEWCFIGQVSCGPVYCADYKDALSCIVYPKCDGTSKQLPWCSASKEKLCADKKSFPCKGYGECVLWEWLLDGKKDCIDGSDEDENYVMPLEHAYRCARNETGLFLPKPVPPPPEDHPSLYVEGCSMCPESVKGPMASVPTPAETFLENTTPRDPFKTISDVLNTQAPLSNFPFFPSEETSHGDFFPPGVQISKVTHPQKPEHSNEPIGEFFPAISSPSTVLTTPSPTISHTFRVITIPSIGYTQQPQAPLIFPMRPDLAPITAPSPLSNWPIPIVTTTPESHHQGALPPITYPTHQQEGSEKIPPIRPEIIIGRPIISNKPSGSSEYGEHPGINPYGIPTVSATPPSEVFATSPPVGFRPITQPVDENFGSSEYGQFPVGNPSGQKPGVDTLIPLVPEKLLPSLLTTRPLIIPSFITSSTTPMYPEKSYLTSKSLLIGHGILPTLIPDSEVGKYMQTKVLPSSFTKEPTVDSATYGPRKTAAPEGFIEEETHPTSSTDNHGTPKIDGYTERPIPETTTLQLSETTTRSKIIHVGPNGVVEESEHSEHRETNQHGGTSDNMGNAVVSEPGSDKVIHIGPTEQTPQSSTGTSSSSASSIETTFTSETSTGTTTSAGDPAIDNCLQKMSTSDSMESVICDCPNGQFKNVANGQCEETLSLMTIKIHVNSICNTDSASFEQKQRALHQKMRQSYKSCVRSSSLGSALVMTVSCEDCSVDEVNRLLTRRSFGEPGTLNVTAEAFGSDLCSDTDFNHCHVYSECTLDQQQVRYSCRCKKGTTDTSSGYGRHCEGFPEESDCVMVFGICLIVWLLFLLGALMLALLSCIACYSLCRYKCCRQIEIHPANAEGLQTVVIGSKAAKSHETNGSRERMPHMRAIFAESLKHSAKGSTSVASAFALADFRRKKVSRPPEMSLVKEEVSEQPLTPLPESKSLPKVSSLAKISTHTISEPPTPVGVIETPILEKNSSSVSLVSANDNAPQLPSLPLPLPVPITTSTSTFNLEEKSEKEREGGTGPQEQQVSETERPSSSHSIGVQPTIWETYRVLGQQYSKSDLTERKPSVDSLEQMFEARLAETARTARTIPTVRTDKSEGSAITFTAKPSKEKPENVPLQTAPPPEEAITAGGELEETKQEAEDIRKNLEDAKETQLKDTDSKLADMIGVTSFHASQAISMSRPGSVEEKVENELVNTETRADSPSLEKSLEAALLIEMAKRGIELPLSPKTPVPTAGEFEKVASQRNIPDDTEDSDIIPVQPKSDPKPSESRKSSAKSTTSTRRSKIPSASQSRATSAKQRIPQIDEHDSEPEVFVPQGAKAIHEAKKKTLRRSGASELVPSTDESDPEVAFFKRLEKMRKESDRYAPVHPGTKYSRRRKPERTLSSISEKSAEIAAEAALEYPVDTSISCPPTTRSFLEPRAPPVPRYVFKRKVFEATDETSDVDIPKLSPANHSQPMVSSPEIPDVTFQRSMENLHKSEGDNKTDTLVSSRSSAKKSSSVKKKPTKSGGAGPSASIQSSRQSSKVGSKVTTPRKGDETPASHTSRSTRHSVISRKIAIRRQELKAVSGSAHDLSGSRARQETSAHTLRGARSVGDLSRRRPHWDISPYRETRGPSSFLPPITPSRGVRTALNSPQPRHRRSDSHFSMTSLPLIAHSPTSFWSSPHFNPSEDSRKPPKEDLWWNPNKRS